MTLLQQRQSLFVLLKSIPTNLENNDENLLTDDEYKDEVMLVDSNSLSKNTTQDNCLLDEQKYLKSIHGPIPQ